MAFTGVVGRSLVSAVEEKYKMDDSEMDIQIFGLPKNSPDQPDDIIVPKLLCIHNANVTHAGDSAKLAKLCRNVCEVDLDGNLIKDWNEVFEILKHVPHCSFLNLRVNPLSHFAPSLEESVPTFKSLIKMVLNYTEITWESLCSVLKAFPSLQELHLSYNNYGVVDLPSEQTFPSVLSLFFNGNKSASWLEIAKLGRAFPNLENLVLINNPLETFPSADDMAATFPQLKSINLSETQIKDWAELEKLRYFPSLCEVRLQDIPLLQGYEDEVRRQLLLGYLPNIQRLNGGKVLEGEKEDAERAFIRYYMEKSEEEQPTRFAELETKHGKLQPLVDVDLAGKDDVTIMVHFGDKPRLVEVSIHQTVAELKQKLSSDLKTPLLKYKLLLKRQGWPSSRELVEPNRTLLNHRIDDGDELFVKEKDCPVRWTPSAVRNNCD